MRSSTPFLALLATSALASPIAFSTREADANAPSEASNPLNKRTINPNTVNILTPAQLTAQRTALFIAQTEVAREAILFPNAPNAANDTFQFINNSKSPRTQFIFATRKLILLSRSRHRPHRRLHRPLHRRQFPRPRIHRSQPGSRLRKPMRPQHAALAPTQQ